jgi:Ca2+-binding RTX toxin-like protein
MGNSGQKRGVSSLAAFESVERRIVFGTYSLSLSDPQVIGVSSGSRLDLASKSLVLSGGTTSINLNNPLVFSGSLGFAGGTGALPPPTTVVGTAGNDLIAVTTDAWGNSTATLNGKVVFTGAASTFDIDARRGDDRIEIRGYTSAVTIRGGAGNDTIFGSAGPDRIFAGDGDDLIFARDGRDTIYAEAGNDTVNGEGASDLIDGGDGFDRMRGSGGNDRISGGASRDFLSGEAGNDTLNGDGGNDVLSGGDGDDNLTGGAGDDSCDGNAGTNTIDGGGGGSNQVSNSNALVMYTYAGDANLSGTIDINDYFNIDTAIGQGWQQGDFNYDGQINGDDYFILDTHSWGVNAVGNP